MRASVHFSERSPPRVWTTRSTDRAVTKRPIGSPPLLDTGVPDAARDWVPGLESASPGPQVGRAQAGQTLACKWVVSPRAAPSVGLGGSAGRAWRADRLLFALIFRLWRILDLRVPRT